MVKISKKDFIELDYTGRIKVDNRVFDTTIENVAKKEKTHNPKIEYGPLVICVGRGHVIEGLDNQLSGKELNKEYVLEVRTENAFGKKDSKLMKIVSSSLFKKQKMNPFPGMQINAEGMIGTVRSITSGRILVDFNHPLAGKDLVYVVKINNKVNDTKRKVEAVLRFEFRLSKKFYNIELKEGNLKLESKIRLPKEISEKIKKELKDSVPNINKINIKEKITTRE